MIVCWYYAPSWFITTSYTDPDVLLCNAGHVYEYVIVYVDLLAALKDLQVFYDTIHGECRNALLYHCCHKAVDTIWCFTFNSFSLRSSVRQFNVCLFVSLITVTLKV